MSFFFFLFFACVSLLSVPAVLVVAGKTASFVRPFWLYLQWPGEDGVLGIDRFCIMENVIASFWPLSTAGVASMLLTPFCVCVCVCVRFVLSCVTGNWFRRSCVVATSRRVGEGLDSGME